ncbi:hypothetical protein V6N12_067145 [Hibiscus sabdariffa]|uniref:Uncharacterized protein n=1 Tax=Hibiscus sabdariffa TaxID=183260 RepID=A0ABR2BUF2_9ROSI
MAEKLLLLGWWLFSNKGWCKWLFGGEKGWLNGHDPCWWWFDKGVTERSWPFKVAYFFPSKDRLLPLHSLQLWLMPYVSSLQGGWTWLPMAGASLVIKLRLVAGAEMN